MATVHPFRALRPNPGDAPKIAAVPYDVVSTEEARVLADDNPLSFLRVSRAEIEMPAGTDPHSEAVYRHAAENFDHLKRTALAVENDASLYVYRQRMGDHVQTGVAGCFSIDEYNRDIIKKHERTRRDKEDDRTRHMIALGAQTGPVFLTYRTSAVMDRIVAVVASRAPLFDFTADDEIGHTLWRVAAGEGAAMVKAFAEISSLYIADGHHRAASAARTWAELQGGTRKGSSLGDGADASTFLAVAVPDSQVQILPYNRVVKDLGGWSSTAFVETLRERFEVGAGPSTPAARGRIAMYLNQRWHTLTPRVTPERSDVIGALDVSVLQDQLLAPILGITDVRTDQRIDFVGGSRGTIELERLVDSGKAAAAFALHPVSVDDLIAVSDAGAIMPPKSTWFEPKLRDGLLIHMI